MAIDPGIPLQASTAPPQPFNPLASLGQAAQTGNALIGLRQNQLAVAGRQALASAYQNTPLDPSTGLPNTRALVQNLMATPGGGLVIPDIIKATQDQQKNQFELQKAGQDQATSRAAIFGGALAPLLAQGDNVSTRDVLGVIGRLHAAGIPVDGAVQQVVSTMPTGGGAPLRQWVLQNFGSSLPAADQASTFLPKVGTQDAGGTIQTYDANPVTNPGATGMTLGKTLSPGEQVAQTPGPLTASGGQTKLPQAAYAAQNGLGALVPGGASAFGTGRPGDLPAALLNPANAGSAASAGVAAPAQSAGDQGSATPGFGGMLASLAGTAPMQTALGPGQQAGLDAAGKASADQWAQLQQSVGGGAAGGAGSAGRIATLQHAQDLLQQLGTQGTGPSSPQTQAIASYLQSVPGVGKLLPGLDATSIANYDEANKYLTQYAAARAGAHGGTTDSQLATTLSSNASTHISNLAAQDVVKANIGLERMDQAQADAFSKATDPATGQPLTPDQFSTFSANWNRTQDPRAYIASELSPQQVTQLVGSLAPADLARFQNTYSTGIQNGWIDPPAWSQPASAASGSAPSTADLAVSP